MKTKLMLAVVVMLGFAASAVFWGCSNSNPGQTLGSPDAQKLVRQDTRGDEAPIPKNGIKGNESGRLVTKYPDPELSKYLTFDPAATKGTDESSRTIGANGGRIDVYLHGWRYSMIVRDSTVDEATEFTMGLEVGKNLAGTNLLYCTMGPNALDMYRPVTLEIQTDTPGGLMGAPRYRLFYLAGGVWVDYGYEMPDRNGLVRFSIPHFSIYSIFSQGGQLTNETSE